MIQPVDMHQQVIAEVLSCQPLFKGLNQAELQHIAQHVRQFRAEKNEVLFQMGEQPQGMHLIVMGQVKLSISSPNGGEKVVFVAHPGQTFGEAMAFLDRPYPVSATATEDSMVLLVDKQHLVEAISTNPQLALKMLSGLSERLHELVIDIESCTLRSSLQKVAGYLSKEGERYGANKYVILLNSNKQTLAAHLSLAPETLSRVLGQLCKKGVIEVHGRNIHVLSHQALSELSS